MRGKWILAVAMAPALLANQCFRLIDVRIEDEGRGRPPTFSFSHGRDQLQVVKWFEVTECAGSRTNRLWRIHPDGVTQHEGRPLRITYGVLPRGYRQETTARTLEPGGCYRATVSGIGITPISTGSETFRILPSQTVLPGESGGLLFSSRAFRQLNRAAVGCARGYRRATTSADSASVAAREYTVLDDRLSCGWLYDHWGDQMNEPLATERGMLVLLGLLAASAGIIFVTDQIPEPPR
jgi:hypothetical protein